MNKLREEMWNSYFNSNKYKQDLANFKNSSYSDELLKKYYDTYLFDMNTCMYKGLDGKNYITYESIPLSAKEGVIVTLFKNEKYIEWSVKDISSSNLYLAAFKQGIRNNGDFTYFDSLSEDIVNNATKQFEIMEKVSVDKTGEWWQLNVFNTEDFINKENLSFVKHDNILGMTFNQVGNMAVPVLSSMMPGVGQVFSSTLLFTSSFGGAAEEAFLSGASYNEALTYATLSASAELLIEHLFSGIAGYGEGWLDNALEYIPNKILETTNLTNNVSTQVIKKLITNGLGEGIEEVTTDFVTPLWQSLTYLSEQSYQEIVKENVSLESEIQTFLVSFLSSMIFGSTEIIQKTNLFNNQLSNLTEQIGSIPSIKEAANTVLAEIIGYDTNVLTSDIVTKLIENASTNLKETLTTIDIELLNNLYYAKNTLDTTKVIFEIDNNQVSVPLGFAMDTLDMTGLTTKYNIENDTIILKNKDAISYAQTLYTNALDNLINTQTKNAMNLETLTKELDTKTYTKETFAIALNILLENNIDISSQSNILLNEENISIDEKTENIYKQAIKLIEVEGNKTNTNINIIEESISNKVFNSWDIVSEATNGNVEYNGIVIDTTGETIKEDLEPISSINESYIETKTNSDVNIETTSETNTSTVVNAAVVADTILKTNNVVNTEVSTNPQTNVESTSNKSQDREQTNVRNSTYLKTRAIMQYNNINNTPYSFNKVYNTLVSKNIYSYISDQLFIESAKTIITASNDVGFNTNEINEIIKILDSNITLEEKYACISQIHIDSIAPKSYYDFTNLYSTYQNIDKVISLLENRGYNDLSISEALLYKSLIEPDKDISRSLYNKSYDYLISKGRSTEVSSLKLQTYYEHLLDERGVHTLFTTNGIDIKIVNGFNSDNKLLNPKEISKILEQSRKYYEGTDLKEIIIYDTFSPNNKYFEKVKYKDYAGEKAFVSAASATSTSISLWVDFDDINALVHEYAHTIDRHIAKTYAYSSKFSNSDAWINAVKNDKDFNGRIISKYATASLEEDFAEFLRVYYKDSLNAAMSYPNRYKISSRYLNIELDENLIDEYISSSPIQYVIDDAVGILSQEGTPLSFIKDYLNNTPYNNFAKKIIDELNMMYENKLEIFEDFTTYQVLDSIKLETNISFSEFINIIKDYLNNKNIGNKISNDNKKILDLMDKNEISDWIKENDNSIELEKEPLIIDESEYTSAFLFKKDNNVIALEKILHEDISLLEQSDLKRVVDYINKGKIKVKNSNLSIDAIHTLLRNNVSLNKIYPVSNIKALKTFIDYFSLDSLTLFDKLNNGFLLMNNADNLYQLFDYHDLSIPKLDGNTKIEELYNLITNTINSSKTSNLRNYTFNYRGLENTEYSKLHPELFLDDNAPSTLKELYYTGKINSGNEYNSEFSKYLEGKSVKGIIHKPLQEFDLI